ncbi:MAG TPA: glycosyltransferase [Ignavibacteriaceae bacterium]|jgi:rhamnosyl/mannosyltransferase|nr:MAG: hypothetical protein B6D44_04560 [Ignavibacteriales bacterium UTCHB2]HQF41829.1 glycosyltransferase [Ignavibacteriaceae bacterium]HQI40853.1 glycosyltransferase [Ignavibacteriaceae bacterium]
MRIVQTNKAYYPKVGGIETTITTLSEGFASKYSSDVKVLVCNHISKFKKIDKVINGVSVRYSPTWGFFSSLPLSPTYFWHLLKFKGDILHIHEPFPLADLTTEFFPGLRKKFTKIVASWHCDITRQKWALPVYSRFIHSFLKKVDRVIVSNPHLINNSDFLSYYKDKCEVIPIGINIDWAKTPLVTNNLFDELFEHKTDAKLLFVGRLVHYKGIEFLIDAMQQVHNAVLVILGSGPLEKELRNRINKLKLEQRIKVINEVDEETLHNYFKSCDIFILPSVNQTEAYGIVQIEAMACGKPLVCTELGTGTSYLNENNITGLVVPPSDSGALADAINKIIKDDNLRLRFGKEGKEKAFSDFTSEKMIKRTYQLYEKLLG